MPPAFSFTHYQIDELNYKRNPSEEETVQEQIETEVELQKNSTDSSLFRLQLKICVLGSRQVSLLMFGYFRWNGDYIKDETENSLVSFGTTILYPYARVAISTISIIDGGTPILLPTINAFDKFENSSSAEVDINPLVDAAEGSTNLSEKE